MKKLLLGTSVLAAVAFAASAQAETPKITVGGTSDFQLGVVSDDIAKETTSPNPDRDRSKAFRSDNEISFKIDGKSDAGLGYGGEIVLEADINDDVDNQGTNAARTSIYLDGNWGRVEMGSTPGLTASMKVDASRVARATGGIDGDFTYFAQNRGPVDYLITPDLVLDYGGAVNGYGDESNENVNKITYYSPKFSGFQVGFGYLPDSENRGQGLSLDDESGTAENIYQIGLGYEGKWDQVGLAVAGTYERGSAVLTSEEDLAAWNVGAKASYMGFSLAGSYGDHGESLRTKNANLDNTNYYTVGGAYENGPFGVSVTYLSSDFSATSTTENQFTNLSVGADYKLAPGLTPYAEVSFFDADAASGTANDNEGHVFLLGTMLNF